jgi:dipeptidase E
MSLSLANAVDCRRAIITSGSFEKVTGGREFANSQFDSFLGPEIKKILVIPYATSDRTGLLDYLRMTRPFGNRKLVLIGEQAGQDVADAQAIAVLGGNTFQLLKEVYDRELIEPLRAAFHRGTPYIGLSAGAHLASPTIRTANDWAIVQPPSLNALNLIPVQFNPHHYPFQVYRSDGDGDFVEHPTDLPPNRIREFHSVPENKSPVLGLPNATMLRWENGRIFYFAPANSDQVARLYRQEHQDPQIIEPNTDLTWLLDLPR